MSKSPQKKVKVDLKTEDGAVYAWAPEYGLTVAGKNRDEALSKMKNALNHLSHREGSKAQMA